MHNDLLVMKPKFESTRRTFGTSRTPADVKTETPDANFEPFRGICENEGMSSEQDLGFGPSLAWEIACYAPQTEASPQYRRDS